MTTSRVVSAITSTAGQSFVLRLLRVDSTPGRSSTGVSGNDIELAVRNAMAIDDLDDDLCLYLGPARDGSMLEVTSLFAKATARNW